MKYLLLFLLALLIIWQWRTHRGNKSTHASAKRRNALPIDMVPCLDCGVHLALHDAVQGKEGLYCSAAHRQRHEH
jgi:uncharacterized protein